MVIWLLKSEANKRFISPLQPGSVTWRLGFAFVCSLGLFGNVSLANALGEYVWSLLVARVPIPFECPGGLWLEGGPDDRSVSPSSGNRERCSTLVIKQLFFSLHGSSPASSLLFSNVDGRQFLGEGLTLAQERPSDWLHIFL